MDIDISVLRLMEREKDLPFEVLASAIEDALLTAYEKTEGAVHGARVELNRKTGHVIVFAPEYDEESRQIGEYDATPAGFGRVAASTARQVIMQRLRDAEDEQKYGHFSGVEGDIVSGVVQQGSDSRTVLVDLGKIEAIMPLAEQVPGERYTHGTRIRVYVVSVRKELRGPQVIVSRTHPGLVEKLFKLEVPEIADGTVEIKAVAREAGHRSKIAVVSHNPDVSAKGACIGPMGQRVRAVMHELNEEKIDIIDYSPDPATFVGRGGCEPASRSRSGTRLSVVAGHRSGGSERPARSPADGVADRHSVRYCTGLTHARNRVSRLKTANECLGRHLNTF
jgi:N utilization substance protein A